MNPNPISLHILEEMHRTGHTEVKHELNDLKASDPLFPPHSGSTCALEVVPVHDYVHRQVQRDRNPRHGCFADELRVAQERGGSVVIRMQEGCRQELGSSGTTPASLRLTQRFLLDHKEDGIE